MDNWTRRKFFLATLTGGIAAGTRRLFGATNSNTQTSPLFLMISRTPQQRKAFVR